MWRIYWDHFRVILARDKIILWWVHCNSPERCGQCTSPESTMLQLNSHSNRNRVVIVWMRWHVSVTVSVTQRRKMNTNKAARRTIWAPWTGGPSINTAKRGGVSEGGALCSTFPVWGPGGNPKKVSNLALYFGAFWRTSHIHVAGSASI